MSSLQDAEVSAILDRNWLVNCLQMQLLQQDTQQLVYQGAGCIRFGAHGHLEYVLYDVASAVPHEKWMRMGGLAPGEFVPAEHFYTLKATDFRNRVWTAEWLDADTESGWNSPGAVVSGRVNELRCSPLSSAPLPGVRCFAITDADVPVEKGRHLPWTAGTPLGHLEISATGTTLKVSLQPGGADLPVDAVLRLEEAISFVLGQQVRWSIEQTDSAHPTIVVRDRATPQRRPRLRPPIEFKQREGLDDLRVLLGLFLQHLVVTSPGPDKRHPLAVSVLNVLRASEAMLEDEALAVCIQAEWFLREHFASEGSPDPATAKAVDGLMAHIEQWSGDSALKKRALGSVAAMKRPRADDVLRRMVELGVVEDRHRQAWRSLRHPSAHGALRQVDVREMVAQCDTVFDLLLRLVFKVIGYTGRYTDHTAMDWPLRQLASDEAGA